MKPAILIGLGLILANASAADAACEGRVLFEDGFDDNLSGWVSLADHERIDKGQYLVTPDIDGSFASLLPTFFFDSERMCIELEFQSTTEHSFDAGIAFWGEDYDNYYNFQIGRSEDGTHELSVFRRVDGRWVEIYSGTSTTFKVGPDLANTLQVDIDGLIISTRVNRVPVKKFRAQRPDLKHRVGVYAQTDADGGTIAFDHIKVTAPDE